MQSPFHQGGAGRFSGGHFYSVLQRRKQVFLGFVILFPRHHCKHCCCSCTINSRDGCCFYFVSVKIYAWLRVSQSLFGDKYVLSLLLDTYFVPSRPVTFPLHSLYSAFTPQREDDKQGGTRFHSCALCRRDTCPAAGR